jgi:glycerol-3-phosphate dehydrogenase (NAD(P)+)
LAAALSVHGGIRIWMRDAEAVQAIRTGHMHETRLPGVRLPGTLLATTDPAEALEDARHVLAVTPAQTTREVLATIAPHLSADAALILCAKGIERGTGRFLSDVAGEMLPGARIAVLSGPGFAAEVARGLPTAVTLAATDEDEALAVARALSTPRLRLYASADRRGVEAGGALKNVIAIAAGAAHGAGLGASASAALVTRGFAEMKRVATAFGGRAETLNGLSGLGDLILTCNSAQSRNFAFGEALARGENVTALAEGAATAHVAARLAKSHGIDAPIILAVAALIDGRATITDCVAALMARPLRSEQE